MHWAAYMKTTIDKLSIQTSSPDGRALTSVREEVGTSHDAYTLVAPPEQHLLRLRILKLNLPLVDGGEVASEDDGAPPWWLLPAKNRWFGPQEGTSKNGGPQEGTSKNDRTQEGTSKNNELQEGTLRKDGLK